MNKEIAEAMFKYAKDEKIRVTVTTTAGNKISSVKVTNLFPSIGIVELSEDQMIDGYSYVDFSRIDSITSKVRIKIS